MVTYFYFFITLYKCMSMVKEKNLKLSFEENSLRGREILKRQPPTTYEEALKQIERLKKNSKVGNSAKKNR